MITCLEVKINRIVKRVGIVCAIRSIISIKNAYDICRVTINCYIHQIIMISHFVIDCSFDCCIGVTREMLMCLDVNVIVFTFCLQTCW